MRRNWYVILMLLLGCNKGKSVEPSIYSASNPETPVYFCCDSVPDWDDDCQVGSKIEKRFDPASGMCQEIKEESSK